MGVECGKIIICMNTSSENKIEKPAIIKAFIAGFNTIANKPYLIIIPILLDLFFWFGPTWRIDGFFQPVIKSLSDLPGLDTSEYTEIISNFQGMWTEIIANFNFAHTIKTLPIGVPSLMVSKPSFLNPLGTTPIFNLDTNIQVFGLWALFLLFGFFLANIYFQNISKQIIDTTSEQEVKSWLRTFSQIVLIPIVFVIILLILSIPVLLLITVVTIINQAMSTLMFLIIGLIILWILMPLIFTPHGIFLYQQNLVSAMMTSIKVVRVSMSQTAWFLLLSFILIEGMDYLWRRPPVDNWFLAVGIFGHAFVVSGVIAASFHYFLDATKFTQTVMTRKIKAA